MSQSGKECVNIAKDTEDNAINAESSSLNNLNHTNIVQSRPLDSTKRVFGFGFTQATFNTVSQAADSFLNQDFDDKNQDSKEKSDTEECIKQQGENSSMPLLDHISTGEENEKTLFQSRCKLFVMHVIGGSWKEKGVGTIRVNHNKKSGDRRLVMRMDGTLKLILNTMISDTMSPVLVQEKNVRLTSVYDLQPSQDNEMIPSLLLLRFKNAFEACQFLDHLKHLCKDQVNKQS